MKAIFSRVRHPSHPGRGHGSLTCHMTQFERSDWLRSANFTNIMIESLSQHLVGCSGCRIQNHDDVMKRRHFPRYWPFLRGIHRSPVNSPHKGQWRRALIFSMIFAWTNGWVNNRNTGDLRPHYDSLWRHDNVNGPKLHYYCRRICGMLKNSEAN